jgi:hypothetical protein
LGRTHLTHLPRGGIPRQKAKGQKLDMLLFVQQGTVEAPSSRATMVSPVANNCGHFTPAATSKCEPCLALAHHRDELQRLLSFPTLQLTFPHRPIHFLLSGPRCAPYLYRRWSAPSSWGLPPSFFWSSHLCTSTLDRMRKSCVCKHPAGFDLWHPKLHGA